MEEEKKLPVHVSIIMDGNGRWAKERGQERIHGHFEGVASVRACAEEAARQGIRYLSLFAFSEENWNRPGAEVGALMELMGKSVCDEEKTLMDNNMRFLVLGNRARLSAGLEAAIRALEEKTAANTGTTLVVFLSYSGKWDLLQAARRMAAAGDDDLEKYLVTAGVPDPASSASATSSSGRPPMRNCSSSTSTGPTSARRISAPRWRNSPNGTAVMEKSNKYLIFANFLRNRPDD